MSIFASAFITPYFVDTDGDLVIVPKELPTAPAPQGGIYGFATQDFRSVAHRNWCPVSWDLGGTVDAGSLVAGFTVSPGPVTIANPVIFEAFEETLTAEWEADGPSQTAIRPDFSLPENIRIMPDWFGQGSDGYYPGDRFKYASVYPVFWDENGINQTGWYMQVKYRVFARMKPYRWRYGNDYFLEIDQEGGDPGIRVEVSASASPSPGSPPPANWTLAEFSGFGITGGGGTTESGAGREATGEMKIQDLTGIDPNTDWGAQTIWTLSGRPFPVKLGMVIKLNYLDRPGYS